jgi:Fe-Mn family superoxide dismutase
MAFELPALPYASDSLEPHIDKATMEIHHGKHHQAYVDNLNKAIAGTDAEKLSIEDICKNISKYPAAVRNNGGGHYNHSLFWTILSGDGGGAH